MIKTYNTNHTIAVRATGSTVYKRDGMYAVLDQVVEMQRLKVWPIAVKMMRMRQRIERLRYEADERRHYIDACLEFEKNMRDAKNENE